MASAATATEILAPQTVSAPAPSIPPLENGDRLTREEFERRYDAMPNLKKAELMEGVVYVPSPVRFRHHSGPHADIITWLGAYRAYTSGVLVGDNGTVRLDLDNDPQPDALLFIEPTRGGQAKIDEDDYVVGAPEFVAEVASSSVSYDLHVKLNVYRRNGVREYAIWRILDRTVDWFVLRQSQYERLAADATGIYRSEIFPGLWLDPAALIAGDLGKVLQVLQQGIASPDHAALVARLQAAGSH